MLTIKEIKEILPHRYPFLMVDRVEEIVLGQSARGYKNVSANEEFFNGHFPEYPVMPGVLIIEALAQAGAVSLLAKDEFKGKIAYFGGIDKAKFRRKVVPGDTLTLEVELIKMRSKVGVAKGVAYVEGKKAAEAELTFIVG